MVFKNTKKVPGSAIGTAGFYFFIISICSSTSVVILKAIFEDVIHMFSYLTTYSEYIEEIMFSQKMETHGKNFVTQVPKSACLCDKAYFRLWHHLDDIFKSSNSFHKLNIKNSFRDKKSLIILIFAWEDHSLIINGDGSIRVHFLHLNNW